MRPSQLSSFTAMDLPTLCEPQRIAAPAADTPKLLNVLGNGTKNVECSVILQAEKQTMDQESANGDVEDVFLRNGRVAIEKRPCGIKVNKAEGELCVLHLGTKPKMPGDLQAPVSSVAEGEQLLNEPHALVSLVGERDELLDGLSEDIQSTQRGNTNFYPEYLKTAARDPLQSEPRVSSHTILSSPEVSKLHELGQEMEPENDSQRKNPIGLDQVQVQEKADMAGEAVDMESEDLGNNPLNPFPVCLGAIQQDEKRYQSPETLDESGKEPLDCTLYNLVVPTVKDAGLIGATSVTQLPEQFNSSPAQVLAPLHENARSSSSSKARRQVSFTDEHVTGDFFEETHSADMSRSSFLPSIFNQVTLQEKSSRVKANSSMGEVELESDETPRTQKVLLYRLDNSTGFSEKESAMDALCSLPPETPVKDRDERNPVLLDQKPPVKEDSQLTHQGLSDASHWTGETLIDKNAVGPSVSVSQEEDSHASGFVPVSHSHILAANTDSYHAGVQTQDCKSLPVNPMKKLMDKDSPEHFRTQDLQEEPSLCSPHVATECREDLRKEVLCSSHAITEQDGTQTVQGLIVELSNLNRLIMNTHRDLEYIRRLRHRRGRPGVKYLPHTGFISKKRKEI
ncbi:hypothetical protein NDU88_001406 [Pleurodeles waltl]|uniref:Uncharacterized protein n=1 Tax=Pleurodeles waltl TaxID=8319 RepID=A0AAV7SAR6_PLEWA|nr:hypothetical protein NDU88_001406 [Pleurodeles waltl]